MDILAEILSVTHAGNALIGQAALPAPWGLDVDANVQAAVHIVQRGSCWLRMNGENKPRQLLQGDLVLVSGGTRHTLCDQPSTPAEPYKQALAKAQKRMRRTHAPKPSAILLCAEYRFEQEGPHPLLSVLPRLIHVSADVSAADSALQTLVRLLVLEGAQRRTGAELVIPRLIDSLLVFIVRQWLDEQPEGGAGWFGALRDPQIGQALALMHERPELRWTLNELARRTSQSRATFARRFLRLVGEPPLTYMTRWRMSLAMQLLRTTELSLETIAERIGYESATALGKAFTRNLGITPGRYRKSKHPSAARAA